MNGSRPDDYNGIVITAPWTESYTRYSDQGAPWFLGRTLAGVLEVAGMVKGDIDGMSITSMSLQPDSPAAMADHFGMTLRWLESVAFGGASGIIALQRAARAVQAGDASVVACLAGDTNRKGSLAELTSRFSRFSMDAIQPYGAAGPNAVFALITQAYMRQYGVAREDFGRLCVAQRSNSRANPEALLRDPMTLDDYLNARPIAEPLHLFDCVMPCAGGEGFLVMREKTARDQGLGFAHVRGVMESHNAYSGDPVQLRTGWHMGSDKLYFQAGVRPADIDLVQTYDDYPVIVFLQLEGLGLCSEGEAALMFRDENGPRLPHNTGGGQLSVGQAGFAGSFLGLVESIRQLTDQAPGLAVPDARFGLASGFGFVNFDRGICSAAAILERGR